MQRSRGVVIIAVTATLLLMGWMIRIPVMYAWMRHTGAVAPHGTHTENFMGKPGMVISIVGHTPHAGETSISRGVGAYHVLIVFPADSLQALDWSSFSGEVSGGASQAWNVWSGERAVRREFATEYNGFLYTAKLGGHRYSLAHGNLFVVHYDARGRMFVRQLRHTFRDENSPDLVRVFQSLLPGDAAVRDLTRFDAPPCPPRKTAPVRGAST